jgi:hypothetical protein
MAKSITERINEAFADDGSDAALKEYGERVFESWKDVSSSLRKSATLTFILIALFELLIYQNSHTFTIGSFSFANASVIQIALPAVIAYVLFDGYLLSARWEDLQTAYSAITEKRSPKAYANDLELFVRPSLPAFWAIAQTGNSENRTRGDAFIRQVSIVLLAGTVILVPLVFEIQAYYHLFSKYSYSNILLWVSAAITALIAGCTAVYLQLD